MACWLVTQFPSQSHIIKYRNEFNKQCTEFCFVFHLLSNKLIHSLHTPKCWCFYKYENRLTLMWHLFPLYPLVHLHENPPMWSEQVPPFKHGFDSHSLYSKLQSSPAKPIFWIEKMQKTMRLKHPDKHKKKASQNRTLQQQKIQIYKKNS